MTCPEGPKTGPPDSTTGAGTTPVDTAAYVRGAGTGPLRGVGVLELAGSGPGPHAATLLADLGADVLRIERPGGVPGGPRREHDLLTRGRPSVTLDLKHPEAGETVLRLVAGADALIEGMRPGVSERLGLGPEPCLARNPALVYGRMTGWGQQGPLATTAGHDLTYLGVSGMLHGLGQDPVRPHFPGNLLGDFGGGSTYLVVGVLAALLSARSTGEGQVVDAAIVDGVAHLGLMHAGLTASGLSGGSRGTGMLEGGAPFYDLYETSDARHVAVAPLEPQFFDELVGRLELPDLHSLPDRRDPASWPRLRERLAARFAERTQAEWTALFEGSDACVAPVLPWDEAPEHPHLRERGTYVERDGLLQAAPAPRFSRTGATLTTGPSSPGSGTRSALEAWGIRDVDALIDAGAVLEP